MTTVERTSRDERAHLRLVVTNERPARRAGPAPLPAVRAGDGWYHAEAIEQERLAREQPSH